jgi:Arabinose efflux permease
METSGRPGLSAGALVFRLLLPFSAGYFLSFLYRSVNAVLAPEIGRAIPLDAADLGLMTSVYFLTFALFQSPLGLLLDRFGPRRVEAVLLLSAALGAATFAVAEDAGTLILGRALVGLGVSACLMAAVKANVQWFAMERLALMNGVILSAGGIGAVAAAFPVQAALAVTDWRGIYLSTAAITVAVAALLFLVVPDRPVPKGERSGLRAEIREMLAIFRDRRFLRVMPLGMLTMGMFMAVQGLWAGPWLRDVAGLAPQDVARGLTVIAATMGVGFLLLGVLAERLGRLNIPLAVVGGAGMGSFWLVTAAMALGWTGAPDLLCALLGFCGSSAALAYAMVARLYPPHMSGRATTSINLTMFLCAFALQWGLGAAIGHWPRTAAGGWPPEAYGWALGLPVLAAAAALGWFIRRP